MQVCGAKLPPCQQIVKDGKAETGLLNLIPKIRSIPAVDAGLARSFVFFVFAGLLAVAVFILPRSTTVVVDAEGPLSMPLTGEPDHRLDFTNPWEIAQIPLALRFDPPMGTENGGLVYNAQKFWEMNERRGGHHTGDDLNGIGGMNTDLGDPVYCTADGLVLYAAEPSPGWGKIVVVAHRTGGEKILHSMYAHLNEIQVTPGNLIARGKKLGTVGTANGYYPAHLHFEIRASDGVDIGAGYAADPLNHLDPTATVDSLRNATTDDLSPSPLSIMLDRQASE